ncbi:MAG TPA: hypothetical protein VG672_23495 [Bryobacteraceae bacterium]|jgi:hypothetical protein|nr:hypothetical protein [Bryobacteraceae bacterium]
MGRHFISIWFFIGLLLAIYGVLILGAGIYGLSHPPAQHVVLANLHMGIWWGLLLLVLGAFYVYHFFPGKE